MISSDTQKELEDFFTQLMRLYAYKRRDEDQQKIISSTNPITLDYQERRYVYLFSPVALTITVQDYGTLAVPAATWVSLPFPERSRLFAQGQGPDQLVFIRATDDQIPFAASATILQTGTSTIGNVGLTSDYPVGAVPVTASSGNQANAIATATLPAAVGRTTYITGFEVTGTGATGVLVVTVTVTNTVSGTLSYTYVFVAGVTTANQSLLVEFTKPIPANAPNTTIVVSCPASGVGGTNNVVNAHGYQL